ncbi:autotransporter outer membrane beta-barrel domain-containing protein [Mesorhizobium sp. B2-2-4]|nr:autotransporter outer membrane beta-barrel domain-containing protein [Mesorhizobium sp. B2-2-4]TPM68645.1 autotransporter outer membrane beta-barrel domain-containing protein [Mesorhizobium sp. B2-2-1]TPN71663.1 autotransporter outer membrane beta-barrel domain-containing protein [Mesorhizobium sp. B1-1-3]
MVVGSFGLATLDILNGGVVTDAVGIVAGGSNVQGVVKIDGAGSTWLNTDSLTVGSSGVGAVTVSNGGNVISDSAYIGQYSDSIGSATIDDATWTNNGTLYVGHDGDGALIITNGGVVSNADAMVGYSTDSAGKVMVDGIGSTWLNSGNLSVGVDGTGTLMVSNSGKVSNTSGYIGASAGSTGKVFVDNSTWTNSGSLSVGDFGTGTLAISHGGDVSSNGGTIGANAGSTGSVFIENAGSTWTNSSDLAVGDFGTGTLAISNGGAVSNDKAYVGKSAGSTGIVIVVDSTWTNSGSLIVGDFGKGALQITQGGAVSNSWATVGAKAGSTGIVFVDGAGSTWTNSSDLIVGDQGTGTLTVSNKGTVSNQNGILANVAGSTGTATVEGAGSTWASVALFVGFAGTGELNILNGGAVNSGLGFVGFGSGSAGTVTVDGGGSTWTNSSNLFVGDQGTGTLNISNGGKVSDTTGYVGAFSGSTGTVTVDGGGSAWNNSSDLFVGGFSTGTLTISNSGTVSNGWGYIGYVAGSTGMAAVDGAGSKWTNSGDLYVGGFGTGTVTVSKGGVVSNGLGLVGYAAGSVGTVAVDGAGSTWASSGDLDVGVSGTGTLTIANGGAVSSGGVVNIAAMAGSVGTLNIGAASGSPAAAAGTLNAASVQFGPGSGAINFNHTHTNYAFASAIGGVGTINQIAGTTNLTADSSGFTGATNVDGGRLAVNGSLANSLVTIFGGILGGNGTVGGVMARSGGIIAPGNSIGTLHVAGNLDQAAGSIYQVELTSTGQSDLIHATGTATIASGAILQMVKTDAAPYVPGTHYTVLQADAGVIGTYTISGLGLFTGLYANYDPTHVYIDAVQAKSFADVGLTPNQIATGGGAESLGSGNPLFDAIFALPSEAAAQDAFDQLSGEIHASAKGMLLEDSRFVRDAASNRIAAAFGDGGAAALPVMAYGEGGPEMVAADTDRFAVWGQVFGSWSNTDSDGNAAAFDRSTGGLLAGADTLVGGWRVGLIGGYGHSSFDADDRDSSGKSDSYHLGLYGGTNWGAIAFRSGAAYSWSSISTRRSVAFNGFADQLSADYDAGTAQVFGELAYKADAGGFKFEPFANLAYVSVHTDGFTETGGAAALTSASTNNDATFTTLGLRGATDFALGGIDATARGMLGWRHAFGDVAPTSVFAFAGGDQFTIAGVPIARDAAVIEAGLDLNMSANATLGLSYTGQFGSGTVDQGANIDLGVKF